VILNVLFALLALVMLTKHLPVALAMVRRRGSSEGTGGIVALVTVLLALGVLVSIAVQSILATRGR
jgi:hypothetical protein